MILKCENVEPITRCHLSYANDLAERGEDLARALQRPRINDDFQAIASDYLREAFASAPGMPYLDVFVFSQTATDRLLDELLLPAAEHYLPGSDREPLQRVWGVDGEYGRHYSFLKAITALWHVLIDPNTRATFKIDLDQVFPQRELVDEGGGTAFDHFRSPLWGAQGRDAEGRTVELGLLAGALVNEKDIDDGLFAPFTRDLQTRTRAIVRSCRFETDSE